MFKIPILFLIFNRPDTTARVFEQIRKIKPAYLYVAADGPRVIKPGENEICEKVRSLVLSQIDWECKIKTLFRDENLGCGKAVSEAIDWFFENEEEGIILEDDTLPDASFFTFCSVMVHRYRYNVEVMHIGGDNFQFGNLRGDGDYYFSALSHVWGWATWRRAWIKYKFHLDENSALIEKALSEAFNNNTLYINYWKSIYILISKNQIDTWDYQWLFAVVKNNGKAICPNVNLVFNIGFGNDATHTTKEPVWILKNEVKSLYSFNVPQKTTINYEADAYTMEKIFGVQETPSVIKNERIILSITYKLMRILLKIKQRITNSLININSF